MYDQFYGLQGRPFQLTPDPHYYFESATHRKALSYLGYGLAQGEGFIVITGDIGAGKTTLVGHLMQTIDPARLTAVKIVSTQVEGDDMLRLAAQSFGLATDGHSKASTLRQIEGFLHAQARAGRRTLLIVDEAQNLPVSAIEELRMLSNFQLGGQSLLQIFLLGQPEFRDLVKSPQLEQLRQRVIATHHLEPMMEVEIEPYILHRLSIAGWSGNPHFTPDAFAALYAATGGVPRRLNALASRVLLLGAIDQLAVIDAEVVHAVVADMGLDVDVTPAPVAPSALDAVAAEPDDPRAPLVLSVEEEEADPVVDVSETVEPEAAEPQEPEAEWAEAEPEAMFDDEAELAAEDTVEPEAEPQPVQAEAGVQGQAESELEPETQPDDSREAEPAATPLPPFLRPVFAAPQDGWIDMTSQEEAEEEGEAAFMERHGIAPVDAVMFNPVEEVGPDQTLDLAELSQLRADMLTEIEELRAEIASLRAVQAHTPFAAPSKPEIDPDALKDCFTLIEERLSALEFRAEEQDGALRRVLTLLVDWVEREEQPATVQAVA